jgi:hypothetical protein
MKKVLQSPIFGTSAYNILCSKVALEKFYIKEGLSEEIDSDELEEIYLSAHSSAAQGKYAMASLLAKFFNTDIKNSLNDLTIPWKIILGDISADGVEILRESTGFKVYYGICEEFAKQAEIVEDAGILPHFTNPEGFFEVL